MVFNWFQWERDPKDIPKIHPAQKPVALLKKLIKTFTDSGDVVIAHAVEAEPHCEPRMSLEGMLTDSKLIGHFTKEQRMKCLSSRNIRK